jgi:hypothetical protein
LHRVLQSSVTRLSSGIAGYRSPWGKDAGYFSPTSGQIAVDVGKERPEIPCPKRRQEFDRAQVWFVYSLPEELRAALRSNGKELPGINGDESWELPVPATFVVDGDRRVVFSFVEIDYRRRLAPEDLVSALRSIAAARESAS